MTTYVALLRAVNLAGKNRIAMADLRSLCDDLGLREPRTHLQSGNVIFDADGTDASHLETLLEGEAAARLELDTDFFVRDVAEWSALVEANPMPDVARLEPARLLAVALKTAPTQAALEALQASIGGPEVVRAGERHVYIHYPTGIGRSKLTTARIEKALGSRGTGRNWNTVLKLRDLMAER